MNKNDIIFAIICGLAVSWIAVDFFGKFGWIFIIVFPILSVIGLWLADLIGKKFLFVHQAGKFVLAGAFADVIDIKVFQFLFWFFPFSLLLKAISFLVATLIKYWTNKYWSFNAPAELNQQKSFWDKQMVYFFVVTAVGLALNVVSFYYFGKIQTGLPDKAWTELCIIFAALVAAIWNFLGYKFLVFKI